MKFVCMQLMLASCAKGHIQQTMPKCWTIKCYGAFSSRHGIG